jgi:hypothetical protein
MATGNWITLTKLVDCSGDGSGAGSGSDEAGSTEQRQASPHEHVLDVSLSWQ